MMKKSIFGLITLILMSLWSLAQVPVIEVGKHFEWTEGGEKFYISDGNVIISVKQDVDNHLFVQRTDVGQLQFSTKKKYTDFETGYAIEELLKVGNRYFLFYNVFDKRNRAEQLFYREIDIKSGAFVGIGKCIMKTQNKLKKGKIYNGENGLKIADKFIFKLSGDNSKLLISYRYKPYFIPEKDRYFDTYGFCVFNQNLDLLWEKKITNNYIENQIFYNNYVIDVTGNVYTVRTVYDNATSESEKVKKRETQFHLELIKFQYKTEVESAIPLVSSKFVKDINLIELPDHSIVCASYYNKGVDLDDVDGIIVFKVKDNKVECNEFEIPSEIVNQYVHTKLDGSKKTTDELKNLVLRQLVLNNDGSYLMIGEQYTTDAGGYYGGSQFGYAGAAGTTSHYDAILLTKIDNKGKLAWMQKVPKKQTGIRPIGGMSFKYIKTTGAEDDGGCLLFMDNDRNRDLTIDDYPETHRDASGGYLTAFKINDKNGALKRYSILDIGNINGEEFVLFSLGRVFALNDKQFVFEIPNRKKEEVLIKVTLIR